MFKLSKKKRNQEIEKIEENENIEKNENSSVNFASIFPSAKDTLEETKQKWKQATAEEILKEIEYESSKGNRHVRIFDSYISQELVKELKKMGYRVEVHPLPISVGPYFEIYW